MDFLADDLPNEENENFSYFEDFMSVDTEMFYTPTGVIGIEFQVQFRIINQELHPVIKMINLN
jgi:hypothetical protein